MAELRAPRSDSARLLPLRARTFAPLTANCKSRTRAGVFGHEPLLRLRASKLEDLVLCDLYELAIKDGPEIIEILVADKIRRPSLLQHVLQHRERLLIAQVAEHHRQLAAFASVRSYI